MTKYHNGDPTLTGCICCEIEFEDGPHKIGDWIKCPECGNEYRLQMRERVPAMKRPAEPEPEAEE